MGVQSNTHNDLIVGLQYSQRQQTTTKGDTAQQKSTLHSHSFAPSTTTDENEAISAPCCAENWERDAFNEQIPAFC